MSPRAAVKRRRRRRSPNGTAGANGAAKALLSQVSALVAQNQHLERENRQLQVSITSIGQAVQRVSSVSGGATRTGRRVGRPAGRPTTGVRRRRRITDPQTLARRRAGLAKARAVLAAKRAAAKKKAS